MRAVEVAGCLCTSAVRGNRALFSKPVIANALVKKCIQEYSDVKFYLLADFGLMVS